MPKATKNCVGKENFDRMSYLYQASILMAKKSLSKNKEERKCTDFVSRYYANVLLNISKKTVLRIDTDIKRKICKGCQSLLILGSTATVRIRKKPNQQSKWICNNCGTVRIYNTENDHCLWIESPQSIVEVLEYKETKIDELF